MGGRSHFPLSRASSALPGEPLLTQPKHSHSLSPSSASVLPSGPHTYTPVSALPVVVSSLPAGILYEKPSEAGVGLYLMGGPAKG